MTSDLELALIDYPITPLKYEHLCDEGTGTNWYESYISKETTSTRPTLDSSQTINTLTLPQSLALAAFFTEPGAGELSPSFPGSVKAIGSNLHIYYAVFYYQNMVLTYNLYIRFMLLINEKYRKCYAVAKGQLMKLKYKE